MSKHADLGCADLFFLVFRDSQLPKKETSGPSRAYYLTI